MRSAEWWDIPGHEERLGKRSEGEYSEEVRALLEDSVKLGLFVVRGGSAFPIVLIGNVDRHVILVQQRDDLG